MPDFYVDELTIDAYEYVTSCTKSEIEELISELVDGDYLPKNVLGPNNDKLSKAQFDFSEKLNKLVNVYYSLSKEDEEILESIIKKYV